MPDARIQAAIKNWTPRFTSQGVDYNDFIRTTQPLERWEEWNDAWCATADMHAALAQEAEAKGRSLSAGEAWVRAALCYHFSKFVWMVDMDKHHAAAQKSVASIYAAHKHLDPTAKRLEIPFEGAVMTANLRRPAGVEQPPLVILVPGSESTKEEFFYWEENFLRRGLATLSMEGPGQGETGYVIPMRHDYEVAVTAMINALEGRDDGLDLHRLGLVGVSLGGYYAPRAAAFEPRVKAVSAIGGMFEMMDRWDRLPPISLETYMKNTRSNTVEETREKVAKFSLAGVAEQIEQPLLVVFGKKDRLVPYEHAERLAAEAPHAELVMYEDGNHVCNNMPYRYRPLVGDWIREQLVG